MIHASVSIRAATEDDLGPINDLYNHYVVESHCTFDLRPVDMAFRRDWFGQHLDSGRHRVFVAADGDRLLGYASSSRFRPKPGYETSVETSVYLAEEAHGKGIGSRLYARLFEALEDVDVHRAYAGIALPNPASVALHERFAFKRVALFTEQGRKFDRYWDVAWYEKALGGS